MFVRKMLLPVMVIAIFFVFGKIISLFFSEKPAKYTIYAANKIYYCNEFQVTGNTIYFRDTEKRNVCINGNYTLIYEREEEKK